MSIRELEKVEDSLEQTRDLEKSGLITPSEAQNICEKRKTFEHRINMRGVDVASFTDYIGHEQRVLALLKSQRKSDFLKRRSALSCPSKAHACSKDGCSRCF